MTNEMNLEHQEPQKQRDRGPLVLLVDDSEDSREMYALFLGRRGFSTAEAPTGQAAIEQATALLPDAIIMDLSLPDMDGETAINRIRNHPRAREAAIVVVSGHNLPADGRTGAWDAFLLKPCLPDALEREIRSLLAARSARRASPR